MEKVKESCPAVAEVPRCTTWFVDVSTRREVRKMGTEVGRWGKWILGVVLVGLLAAVCGGAASCAQLSVGFE